MKINKLILEQLSSRDQSKLNSLKASGYSEISTRKYNSEPTKFDYETVGSGANIVYLAKPKVATNNNNNNNNSGNNNNNNSSNNNNNNSNNQPPANTDLNDYIGKYKAENGEESEIKIDGAGLKANLQGIPFKFTKTSKDLFDVVGYGLSGRCEFLRDSSNKVIGLTAEIGGHSVKATKVGVSASAGSGGSSNSGGSSSVPAINPQASSGSSTGSQFTGSISGWPKCVITGRQMKIFIITDKTDKPVTYFKDQAGADDFLSKNQNGGYEIKKEICIFYWEDCELEPSGPFSCEMYLRKNGTFVSNGDFKIGQWKCNERNRVQYFDKQLSEEKIRKNIRKGLNKLIK
jgi:hypothetical protein